VKLGAFTRLPEGLEVSLKEGEEREGELPRPKLGFGPRREEGGEEKRRREEGKEKGKKNEGRRGGRERQSKANRGNK